MCGESTPPPKKLQSNSAAAQSNRLKLNYLQINSLPCASKLLIAVAQRITTSGSWSIDRMLIKRMEMSWLQLVSPLPAVLMEKEDVKASWAWAEVKAERMTLMCQECLQRTSCAAGKLRDRVPGVSCCIQLFPGLTLWYLFIDRGRGRRVKASAKLGWGLVWRMLEKVR